MMNSVLHRLPPVICYLMFIWLSACVTIPPPPTLQVQISGQVIDRQFREIVVTVINDGTTRLYDFPVVITMPPKLAVIRESHEGGLDLQKEGAGTYRYVVRRLDPSAHVTARFPFRREASAALAGAEVRVVAANVESRRTFSE